jgi:hypothetical protein
MSNCKNCAGTVGKNDVCNYCGTYRAPKKINAASFRYGPEPRDLSKVYSGGKIQLTAMGKITLAILVIGIVFATKYLLVDSKIVSKKETPGITLPSTSEMLKQYVDSTGSTVAIMGDGDWNLAQSHIYATGASTGEDKFIK